MHEQEQQVYTSSTRGPIPLSFTGRHLMQSLREAIADAINQQSYDCEGQQLSRARGRLVKYISHLERRLLKKPSLKDFTICDLTEELYRRIAQKGIPVTGDSHNDVP